MMVPQGIARVQEALRSHMWPGMLRKKLAGGGGVAAQLPKTEDAVPSSAVSPVALSTRLHLGHGAPQGLVAALSRTVGSKEVAHDAEEEEEEEKEEEVVEKEVEDEKGIDEFERIFGEIQGKFSL